MRREILEDESNTERWMVSYADFITLLFAFFVVMYAISSVNDEKYRVLSDTLAETFAVDSASLEPVQVGEPSQAASPHIVDLPDSQAMADQEFGDTYIEDPVEAAESLLGGFAQAEGIAVQSNNDWLEVAVDASVLFAPGQAALAEQAKRLLAPAVALLRSNKNPVTIEGYTDNVPSTSAGMPSNWELSAARASAVARFFVDQGIRAERLSAVGYGENHPIETNATPAGRAANRRVVIVVARRSDLSRNLNAGASTAAYAPVRTAADTRAEDSVVQVRTAEGGLLIGREQDLLNNSN